MRNYRSIVVGLLAVLPVFFVSALQAQSNGKKQEQAAQKEEKDIFSIFKKKETADSNTKPTSKKAEDQSENDKKTLKILHKDAKTEVKASKKERKAAERKEEAARARAEAIKAEKRALRKEKRYDKADEKAVKARTKAGSGNKGN